MAARAAAVISIRGALFVIAFLFSACAAGTPAINEWSAFKQVEGRQIVGSSLVVEKAPNLARTIPESRTIHGVTRAVGARGVLRCAT